MTKLAFCALLLCGSGAFAQTQPPSQPPPPPAPPTQRMHGGMMHHQMMCGEMASQADITVENTKEGAIIRFKAKDPAQVGRVQQLAQMMQDCMRSAPPPKPPAEQR
jgi:hypothetical protein